MVIYTLIKKTQHRFMQNKLLFLFIAMISTFGSWHAHAQQDAQYSQYMYNQMQINPAYAGSREVLSIVGLHRSQWVGIDGAPTTQNLSVHSPVGRNNIGLGLDIINDNLGPARETAVNANFSYSLQTSRDAKLSFGLKAGANLLDVDYNKLNIYDPSDPNYQPNNIDNKFSPQIGVGLMYYTDKFYAGLSAPNLLQTKHFDSAPGSKSLAKERINYYLLAGYVIDFSRDLKFKPALMTKAVSGAPLQVDVSANFMFYEKFILGAAYRWDAAVSGMAGFQITDGLLAGLAYDTDTTDFGEYNNGSFEFFLRFELFKKYQKMLTPRFF